MPESSRGRNLRKEVDVRHQQIRKLLKDGLSVAEVSRIVGLTPKRVYVVAERWGLPTNPKIWPGSDDECTVARMVASGWTPETIGKLLNQSPASIRSILTRIKEAPVLKATAKRFGVDAEGQDPGRQPRAKAPANARRRRRSG